MNLSHNAMNNPVLEKKSQWADFIFLVNEIIRKLVLNLLWSFIWPLFLYITYDSGRVPTMNKNKKNHKK